MKIGTVVISKSGGFPMTVSKEIMGENMVVCQWFDYENQLNEGDFSIDSLFVVEDIEKRELKPFEPEIKYASKGKTPAGDSFCTIKEARGYYQYLERGGIDSIAFILYNGVTKQFGLIYESKPPRDEIENREVRMTTAFGGSIDMSEKHTYQDICQTEVAEEAGYDVPLDRITSVGQTLVSSQMSQMVEGFLVDITGIEKTLEAEYEKQPNTAQEANEFSGNKVLWFDADEMMDNNDWKSVWIFTKAVHSNIISKG